MLDRVTFDPQAGEPVAWLKFLEQLWPDDTESHRLLQEWFGLCLTTWTGYQKALLIVGPPCSGKTVIAQVLTDLLGGTRRRADRPGALDSPAVSWAPLPELLVRRFGMQSLLGKTLAVATHLTVRAPKRGRPRIVPSLPETDFRHGCEKLLKIVAEADVVIDRKGREPIETRIRARFMLLSQEVPRFRSDDMVRDFRFRMVALQLQRSLADGIRDDEFTAELPAILLWAIEGWGRLRARGRFEQPVSGLDCLDVPSLPSRAEASRAFHDQQEHRPPAGVGLDPEEPEL